MAFRVAPQEQCVLRQARKDDSRYVAELIEISGDLRPDFPYVPYIHERRSQDPLNEGPENSDPPTDLARLRASRRDECFAYSHSTMAEIDGHVAGVLLGYKLSQQSEVFCPDGLPQCLRPVMDPGPALLDTFYVNTLALYPAYQKHGLGARLLDTANLKALKMGCIGVSLEVNEDNVNAVRFYARHGFVMVKRRPAKAERVEPYDEDIAFLWRPVSS